MTRNEMADTLREAQDLIWNTIYRGAERHYETFIFQPRIPGETPFERFSQTYALDEWNLHLRLGQMIAQLESESEG